MTRPPSVLSLLLLNLACTGEMSDFQAIVEYFREKDLADATQEDGVQFLTAKDYATYLGMRRY